MLPAPAGIYPGTRENDPDSWRPARSDAYSHPCANFDLYDAPSWKLDLNSGASSDLQRVLDGAREFHERMYEAHLALGNEQREKMTVIAGVGQKTLFRLAYHRKFFGLWEKAEKVTEPILDDRHREGDGRVPVASAALEGVRIHYIKGVHGGLVNIPAVYAAIFDYLNGGEISLPDSPRAALEPHLAVASESSQTPALDRSPEDGEADLWNLEADPVVVAELKTQLEQERLPAFTRVKIL